MSYKLQLYSVTSRATSSQLKRLIVVIQKNNQWLFFKRNCINWSFKSMKIWIFLFLFSASPQSNKKNEIVAITLNDNASISVSIQVYPPPEFHWTKNNMPLSFRNIVKKHGINKYQSTLVIPSATQADLGVYRCYINNTYGFLVITKDIRERSKFFILFYLCFWQNNLKNTKISNQKVQNWFKYFEDDDLSLEIKSRIGC